MHRILPWLLAMAALLGAVDGFSAPLLVGARGMSAPLPARAISLRRGAVMMPPVVGARMSEGEGGEAEEAVVKKKGPQSFAGQTEWKLNMRITGPPKDGVPGADSVQVSCKVLMREEDGYEPPQGPCIILDEDNKYVGGGSAFWKLDEDPSLAGFDRAGFWIWGLLEEPQYPFITFNLDIKQPIPLGEGEIPAGPIFAQAKITRSKEDGCTLSDGQLTLKKNVVLDVDLLGLSEGILQDILPVGTFTMTPL